MKTLILTFLTLGAPFGFAESCPLDLVQKQVSEAVLSIEKLNGSGDPLTTELYSYSSRLNTWSVVLSYSGVQRTWTVVTTQSGCQIKALSVEE